MFTLFCTRMTNYIILHKQMEIYTEHYRNDILGKILNPRIKQGFRKNYYCYMPVEVPAHTAKTVLDWCK